MIEHDKTAWEKFRTPKEEEKYFDSIAQSTVKCKCGHSIVMTKADRTICNWCGSWIYRTPQIEFKYKLKEVQLKEGIK